MTKKNTFVTNSRGKKVNITDPGPEMQYLLDLIGNLSQELQKQSKEYVNRSSIQSLWQAAEKSFAKKDTEKNLQDINKNLSRYETRQEAQVIHTNMYKKVETLYGEARLASTTFNYTDQPLTGTFITSFSLPADAVITECYYEVTDTFTSDDTTPDSTTMKMTMESDGDIQADIAINDGANPYDAGFHDSAVSPTTSTTNIRCTETRTLKVEVTNGAGASAGLTAGAMTIYVKYHK